MRTKHFDKLRELYSDAVFGFIVRFSSKRTDASNKSAIVFAPHQDDETFGCGGLIALKRERNIPVKVVFLTDGTASHAYRTSSEREQLKTARREEARSAGALLGLERNDLMYLDYVDGMLGNMSSLQREDAVKRILEILLEFQPEEIYVPHQRDRHRDHEASYNLVMTALERSGLKAQVVQYPIWLVWWSALGWRLRPVDLSGAKVLRIDGVLQKKQAAIACYRSQHEVLPKGFLKRFLSSNEAYFVTQRDNWFAEGAASETCNKIATSVIPTISTQRK